MKKLFKTKLQKPFNQKIKAWDRFKLTSRRIILRMNKIFITNFHTLCLRFSLGDKKRACLLHPCSLMRPTKAFRENTNAKDTPGTRMCHTARPSQDMSFPDKFWSFHQNEQVRVVTRSFYLYHCA